VDKDNDAARPRWLGVVSLAENSVPPPEQAMSDLHWRARDSKQGVLSSLSHNPGEVDSELALTKLRLGLCQNKILLAVTAQ
jgi:hypothetical protein